VTDRVTYLGQEMKLYLSEPRTVTHTDNITTIIQPL
jgi:hypothetical protein